LHAAGYSVIAVVQV